MRKWNGGGTGSGQGCTFSGATGLVIAGCSGDWNTWWLGSRTQWNVTKDFYMGVDVMYSKLEGGSRPTADGGFREILPRARQYRRTSEQFRRPIRTTGRSGSASTATSIPDPVIMDV